MLLTEITFTHRQNDKWGDALIIQLPIIGSLIEDGQQLINIDGSLVELQHFHTITTVDLASPEYSLRFNYVSLCSLEPEVEEFFANIIHVVKPRYITFDLQELHANSTVQPIFII